MRTINVSEITSNIKEMCIEANHYLTEDMDAAMKKAVQTEKAPLGKQILNQLQDNLEIAAKEMIPICQDTGMAVVLCDVVLCAVVLCAVVFCVCCGFVCVVLCDLGYALPLSFTDADLFSFS